MLRRVVGCFFAARCLIFFGMTWFWDGCFFGGGPIFRSIGNKILLRVVDIYSGREGFLS